MKFVLAFLLLIGISCQIGRGDCAPAETIIGDLTEKMGDGIRYVKDTIAEYMPDIDMPSIPVPSIMKDGYDSFKDGVGDMAEGAGQMAKDTVGTISDALD
ncbi:uncharacterized protein LOC111037034 [Myzus persicae]|uniref:uncharacterized protein LOC111037034 n=1 Tax=Myzus persicae TaxID=13164 RepID=UPI000B935376|nr:uncharacterized protein LOC111037034 [Myzus persicae]